MQDISSELRWILLAGGVLLWVVLAIVGRRRGQAVREERRATVVEPVLDHSVARAERARHTSTPVPHLDEEINDAHRQAAVEKPASDIVFAASPATDDLPEVRIHDTPDLDRVESPMTSETVHTGTRWPALEPASEAAVDTTSDSRTSEPATAAMPPDTSTQTVNASLSQAASASSTESRQPNATVRKTSSRKIVVLRLSSGAQRFDGAKLRERFDDERLQYGKYDIYHRVDEQGLTLFSVASMVEPGTFDPPAMPATQFPGVTLFMQLPGPHEGAAAYDQMLGCARNLEEALGGMLQDERGAELTPLRAERIREEIVDFQHLFGGDTVPTLTSEQIGGEVRSR